MTIAVVLREDLGRYEGHVGGHLAGSVDFHDDADGVRVFTAVRMVAEFEGRGLGNALVSGALDAEQAAGRRIQAKCSFVKRFIERNPEYRDLLAPTRPRKKATGSRARTAPAAPVRPALRT